VTYDAVMKTHDEV